MHRLVAAPALCVLLAGAAGCSSGDAGLPPSTSMSSTTQGMQLGPIPTIDASSGCGPDDSGQIIVKARDVGTEEVLIQVLFDGVVYDFGRRQTGPTVGEILELRLPAEAYESGTAEARVVSGNDTAEVIVSTNFELFTGGCG